ncbi:hypothetical protein ACROYT_G026913 [Oculina patagonica]
MLHRPVLAAKDASAGTAAQIMRALEEIWQLCVLCLMAAILSGILIWFFDHKANSGHFPNSFWSGIREGLWWAIVTMTTVGYGDKTPKSFLGRAYASLWMIIGMLLMSTFTAQISSSITADGLSPLNEIFGSKIGVPLGSRNFFMRYCYGAESVKAYSTEHELLDGLQNGTLDKIWLFDCKAKSHFDFMIVDVLEEYSSSPSIGVGIQLTNRSKTDENFTYCMEYWRQKIQLKWEMNWYSGSGMTDDGLTSGMADDGLKSGVEDDGLEDINETDMPDVSCFKQYSRGKQRQRIKPASSETHLTFMDYILLACGCLTIILMTIGTLWNISARVRHMEKTAGNNVDIEMGVLDIGLGTVGVKTKELTPVSAGLT